MQLTLLDVPGPVLDDLFDVLPPEVVAAWPTFPRKYLRYSAKTGRNPIHWPKGGPYAVFRYDVTAFRWKRGLAEAGWEIVAETFAVSRGEPWRLTRKVCPPAWRDYFAKGAPLRHQREDAAAVVSLAVVKAATYYDPATGRAFNTYLGRVIASELARFRSANPPWGGVPFSEHLPGRPDDDPAAGEEDGEG